MRSLLPHLEDPETALCAALLHDLREDYGVDHDAILNLFGAAAATSVDALTKEFRGVRRPETVVFDAIAADASTSVVKPADRVNIQLTALGMFTVDKIESYAAETVQWFFPMMRDARRAHHHQVSAYENLKLMLEAQVGAITTVVEAVRTGSLAGSCSCPLQVDRL